MSIAYLFSFPCEACEKAKEEGLYDDIRLRFTLLPYQVAEEDYRDGLIDIWREEAYRLAPTVFIPEVVEEKCLWIELSGVRSLAKKCRSWANKKGINRWVSEPITDTLDVRNREKEEIKGGV